MRLATIDLGSNTVRFLLVDAQATDAARSTTSRGTVHGGSGPPRWTIVDHDQQITRLGEGVARTGVLDEAAKERTRAVVERYVTRGTRAGAEDIAIVATSAMREAANGPAFAADLEARTGRRVRVIAGDDEARLTLRGIQAGLGSIPGRFVAFDIGGGSTEYVLAADGVPRVAVSLRLGVVPLAETCPFRERVDVDSFDRLRRAVLGRLEHELPAEIRGSRPGRLIGTAGTATTLAALDLGLVEYDATRVQGHRLARAAITAQLQRLSALTLQERAALPCLEPGRADLIVPGIAIVLATLDCLGVDAMQVSDWGIREGIVAEMLDRAR